MVRRSRRLTLGIFGVLLLSLAVWLLGVAFAGSARADKADATPPSPAPTALREEETRRTEYAKTYELSDGTFRTVFCQTLIHFKDESGVWRQINPTFVPSAGVDAYTTASAPVG